MALGYAPEEEEDVAGQLPANAAPAPAAEPTVMTPLGQLPVSSLPPDQQPSPDLPPATPGPGQPAGAAGAGAPATDATPTSTAGALPPPPVPPQPTGDPAKDIEANQQYGRALAQRHAGAVQSMATAQNDVAAQQKKQELALEQEAQKRRDAEQQQRDAELAQRRQQIAGHTQGRANAIGDIESGKYKEQSTGAKIASVIALALGAKGAGLSAAGGHPTGNLAAQAIDNMMDREYQHAQQRVANANQAIQEARYGYRDAEDNHRAALNDIDADMAAKYRLVAKEAAVQLQNRGASPEQIQQSDLVYNSLAKASQYEDQIHAREIEAQRKAEALAAKQTLDQSTIRRNNAQADSAEALAGYRKGRTHVPGTGAGGGGGSKAIDAMNAAAKAGGTVGDIEAAGVGAGMSRKEALAQAKALAGKPGKGGGSGGVDAHLIVHDVGGQPLGMAPSARNVASLQSDIRTRTQALKQLEELRDQHGLTTRDPRFHDAVLALASVTTAGKTDTTTHHEEATLTNFAGMPDTDAIQRKIEQVRTYLTGLKQQLTPLPDGYREANAPAPQRKSLGGGIIMEKAADGKWYPVKNG